MKVLSERVSILQKENLVSVVILAGKDKKKQALLITWLFAWTVCGVIVLTNYFKAQTQDQKMFIIIYLAFWAYFEVSIIRGFIWKKWGKEKIWIQDGIFHYQREINNKGRIREWQTDLITKVEVIELKATRWADTFNQSYWVRGGERLQIESQGKIQAFGMQLSDAEAKEIMKALNKYIR